MVSLDAQTLRRLQQAELELLREVDRVCQACGIRYSIIAGTLLGAVRHGGVIPWDDDADVAMLRPEYERFREACRTHLDHERFCFQDIAETEGYRWGYGKLRLRDSLFVREHQEHMPYEQGVFIDVFPLDPVPQDRAGRVLWDLRCLALRKALWARVGKVADGSPVLRGAYALVDRIPEASLRRWYWRLVRQSSRIKSDWVRILTFPTPNGECGYLRRWYEEGVSYEFEGASFSGVGDYEEYLTFKYGDWRSLPPDDQRKVHPASAIRLPEEVGA